MRSTTEVAAAVLWVLAWQPMLCKADVIVVDRLLNKTIDVMADMPSLFGPQLSLLGMKGLLRMTWPRDGCSSVTPPPTLPFNTSPSYSRWVALIHRRNCSFAAKVLHAQAAGYAGVIVMNIGSDYIEPMSSQGDEADNVTIPSVFIGQSDGDTLEMFFRDYKRFGIIITGDLPNIQSYLLPFAITVAVCFLAMLLCMVIKCVRDYRRSMRHRLSWRALRKLPLHKFSAGDPYEVCAICLDDYAEGDKLRVLPCNHGYHSRCIDPWLTKRRRVCPVCKQKVRIPGDSQPDSDDEDSDTERSNERAPLLQQATQVSAGTFSANRENPFQRAGRRREERRQRRANRAGYNQLDDSIETASDESTGASSDERPLRDSEEQQAATEEDGTTVYPGQATSGSLLPVEGEQLQDQLDVVTVTRSVKKPKKKKTKKSKSSGGEGSSDGEPSDGRHVVLQVEAEEDVSDGKEPSDPVA